MKCFIIIIPKIYCIDELSFINFHKSYFSISVNSGRGTHSWLNIRLIIWNNFHLVSFLRNSSITSIYLYFSKGFANGFWLFLFFIINFKVGKRLTLKSSTKFSSQLIWAKIILGLGLNLSDILPNFGMNLRLLTIDK